MAYEINAETSDLHPIVMCTSKSENVHPFWKIQDCNCLLTDEYRVKKNAAHIRSSHTELRLGDHFS